MRDIDKQGQEELDREDNFLAFVERTERESRERLVGVDRISRTIALVPIDRPELALGEGQDFEAGSES